MANDLKYAVIFSAVDQLSDKLSSFGGGFLDLGNRAVEAGGKIGEAGEELVKFGERLSLDTMLMKDGADRLREMSDAISEPAFAMQKSLAGAQAMLGLTSANLAELKQRAIDFSNTHPGVTAEQYVEGFTRMREVFQDTAKAMDAEGTAAMLGRFGIDGEAATNLFTAAFANLHATAAVTGDQLIKTIQQFGLAPDRANQLAMAVGRIGGVAAQTNTPLSELLALTGAASQQLGGGGRGAMVFASMIREMVQASAEGKSSIDFTHGLAGGLSQLRAQIAGMPSNEKLEFLKKMGATDPAAMVTYLNNLDSTLAKQRAIADSTGALGTAYKTGTADAADQIAQLHQNVTALYDAMASPALPMYSSAVSKLTGFVQGATDASGKHSAVLGDVVFGMSAVGNVAYAAISALSTLGAASIFVGQGMKLLKFAPAIFGALISPIGLTVAAIGALAFGAYEIYEHWSGIKSFFSGLWSGVMGIFTSVGNWTMGWAKTVGEAVLMGIAGPFGLIGVEIYKHWDSIKAACEKIGSGILGYFEGHSPPKVGPLSHLGEHITIAETIAEHIRPSPVIAAIRRTAAAAAIASTTVIAAGAGGAMAGPTPVGAGGSVGGAQTVVHLTVHIDGAKLSKEDLIDGVSKSAYEVARILDRERERKERTVLS